MGRLEDQLNEDLKASLKERDALRRSVIQMIRSLVLLEKKKGTGTAPLDDERVQRLVQSHAKKLSEALGQAERAGRDDLVERTKRELSITQAYLPSPLDGDELRRLVDEVVAQTSERGAKAMGAVMREVLARAQGRAEGKAVQAVVRQALGLGG